MIGKIIQKTTSDCKGTSRTGKDAINVEHHGRGNPKLQIKKEEKDYCIYITIEETYLTQQDNEKLKYEFGNIVGTSHQTEKAVTNNVYKNEQRLVNRAGIPRK
ncbi:unnamed protein product [Caenorhabditis angaria]|uniref:Uncharacterized protein n=1 Tax=Caenorhabditis angaria TaxID=860376 RepID=A0A9P1J1R6_9PELO|nr:unnamed protein product [Caenorhabditis angaria]